jgi:tRNA threonylcarbamoyl adenosine modification protein YeaZ
MITLFLDTHNHILNASLILNDKVIIKEKESVNSHSVLLLPMIKEILDENSLKAKDINKIIVVNGPGSFTGIRIGLTVAKVLAYSLNIPIYTISSLKAYLISNDIDNKCFFIEDNKGFYLCALDKNNEVLIEECYLEELPNLSNYTIVEDKLDINKIIKYLENAHSLNPHSIKANYIKKIEVEK